MTPMAFARAIAAWYRHQGKSSAEALRLAQITPRQLANVASEINARQMETLCSAAMRELSDEGLGALGRKLPWGSYGMLARASMGASDLGTALRRWCRHHGLLTEAISLKLASGSDTATIIVDEHDGTGRAALPSGLRELSLVFVLRNIHGLACWYIDSRIPLKATRFPFPAPRHAPAYTHMFPGATLAFGTTRAEVQFDSRYLALPLRRDEKALNQMLRQQSLNIPVLPYRRDRLLGQQVRQLLAVSPSRTSNAEALATLLKVSARTLHRQLQDEGSSLQSLKDAVRFEHAQDLLNRTKKPVKQVAAAAGFRNEKSFIRAFRAWSGKSPGVFRKG